MKRGEKLLDYHAGQGLTLLAFDNLITSKFLLFIYF